MTNLRHTFGRLEQDNLKKQQKVYTSKNQQEHKKPDNKSSDHKESTLFGFPDNTNKNKGPLGSGKRQDSK